MFWKDTERSIELFCVEKGLGIRGKETRTKTVDCWLEEYGEQRSSRTRSVEMNSSRQKKGNTNVRNRCGTPKGKEGYLFWLWTEFEADTGKKERVERREDSKNKT